MTKRSLYRNKVDFNVVKLRNNSRGGISDDESWFQNIKAFKWKNPSICNALKRVEETASIEISFCRYSCFAYNCFAYKYLEFCCSGTYDYILV